VKKQVNIILEDSRQQSGRHEHVNRWLIAHGVQIRRTKLYVGDYTLPADQSVVVDTKYGLQEVYGNIIQDHERFRREIVAAQEAEIRLIVLVEESGISSVQDVANWNNPRAVRWERTPVRYRKGKPPASSNTLCKAMQTMSDKYGVEWMFCSKDKTAEKLCELLRIEVNKCEV
jgi:hypothetical protein